jgi:OmpA-OmpF porin, OOP family
MSKKVVFPLIAVMSLGLTAGSLGCKAEASLNAGGEATAEPPPPPPEPAKPEEPPPPPPEVKTAVLKPIGKAKIENDEIKIPGKIKFDFEKATIKEDAETKEILNTMVEVLKENPAITKLRIEGHTDDKGTSEHNHKLSQARAESVATWLEKHGVDKSRLDMKGWGEEHPVAKNDTKENREANRRVEFKVWELEGKQTEVAKKEAATGAPATAGGPSAQGVAASAGVAGGNPEKAGDKKDAKKDAPKK